MQWINNGILATVYLPPPSPSPSLTLAFYQLTVVGQVQNGNPAGARCFAEFVIISVMADC